MKKFKIELILFYIVNIILAYSLNNKLFNNELFTFLFVVMTIQLIVLIGTIIYYRNKWNVITTLLFIIFIVCHLLIYGSILYVEYRTVDIKDVSDFNQMHINPDGDYRLVNDIEMSSYVLSDDFDFSGHFDGNDYTLTNLKTPVFYRLEDAIVMNIALENVEIKMRNEDDIGALSKYAKGSIIYHVNVTGDIEGRNDVGGILGHTWSSNIELSSFSGNITGEDFVGGIVGEGGTITKSYVNALITGESYVSGFSGVSSSVYNSISNSYIRGMSNLSGSVGCSGACNTENSIILGQIESIEEIHPNLIFLINEKHDKNNLFLGKINSHNNSGILNSSKVYVIDENIKLDENNEYINKITIEDLMSEDFYFDLNFDDEVWNFEMLEMGYYPSINDSSFENLPIED